MSWVREKTDAATIMFLSFICDTGLQGVFRSAGDVVCTIVCNQAVHGFSIDLQEQNLGSPVGLVEFNTGRETAEFKMDRAGQYKHLAADVRSRASRESNPIVKAEWENLAKTYVRLAKQADADTRNTGLTYDPIRDMLERARS
jgi:hypothetical protein